MDIAVVYSMEEYAYCIPHRSSSNVRKSFTIIMQIQVKLRKINGYKPLSLVLNLKMSLASDHPSLLRD